ncbi:Riboflavin biosynthesis protein PYRR [Arachis hypogaea]|nr:Riboflavin biosynthesis protein PYRR [Arachis hypogaea]
MLLLTTGSVLVEASPHDFFWGGGRDGKGLNYLGRLLMKLRSEFLGESSSSCEQLKFLTYPKRRCQLLDDITPDFKVVGEESQGLNDLSLAGLSIHDEIEGLMFHSSKGSRYIFNEQEELSQQHINGNNFTDRLRFFNSSFREDPSSGSTLNTSANSRDRPIRSANKLVSSGQEGFTYDDNSGHGFLNDIFAENAIVDDTNLNPLEF